MLDRGGYLLRAVRACAALTALLLSACQSQPAPPSAPAAPPANVVLISVDTLRADHLGCYGYFRDTSPAIDAFSREAIFFEQAYAPMATTLPSHLSLLTGLFPLEHGTLANFGDGGKPFGHRKGIRSVAEWFSEHGYDTGAFVSSLPLKRLSGFNRGFSRFDEPQREARPGARTTDAALAWLQERSDKPFFLFIHYYDPHTPYSPPAPYDSQFTTDADLERWLAERGIPEAVEPGPCRGRKRTVSLEATNQYDGEIRYTDAEVSRLFDALRRAGKFDNSVIIFTADHGEGLNQHHWPQHGRVWNEQLHVPLLIRFPSGLAAGAPTRVERLTSLADVFPTVVARLKPSWAAEFMRQASGVDALGGGGGERPLLAQRSGRPCPDDAGGELALILPGWRFHHDPEQGNSLYDMTADPFELASLSRERADVAEKLAGVTQRLAAHLLAHGASYPEEGAEAPEVDEETRRQLEALGYTGGASQPEVGDDAPFEHYPSLKELQQLGLAP